LTMLRSSQGFKFGLHSNLNLIPPNPDLCSTLLLIVLLPHEIVGPKFMSKMIHKPPGLIQSDIPERAQNSCQ